MKRHDKIEDSIEIDLFVLFENIDYSVISVCAKVWAE